MSAAFDQLQALGLSHDEAKIYLELLKRPATHLKLAHATGINRTKVYRIAEQLERRSLIARRFDDRGMALVAADPSTLEIELVSAEVMLRNKRAALQELMPQLETIQAGTSDFAVHTYAGEEGFKQMLWRELDAEGELLSLGGCLIENLVTQPRWAERYRAKFMAANHQLRELVNRDPSYEASSQSAAYLKRYRNRYISEEKILLRNMISIYNDTVSVYRWRGDRKMGVEVVDPAYAQMMRQVFNHYWEIAEQ